jgi:nucleotide-binding universal stress UspA family protein
LARILVATDGSACANHAAAEAVRLLGTDHEFVVLAVAALPAVSGTAAVMPAAEISLGPDEIQALDEAAEDAAHEQVERTADRLREAGAANVKTRVVDGEAGAAICSEAEAMGADVIVVGNRGASLLSRVLTGSVSTYVVHHAKGAVLVVRDRS